MFFVRMPRLLALVTVAVLAACGGAEGPSVVLTGEDGEHVVAVEIADSAAERERGLMGRTELGENDGMVFLYDTDQLGGFWMKDTLIPLSIAFYDAAGRIVRILDMGPCRRDPCPVYEPGVAYRGALEVNRGAFARWDIREGDRLRLERS
jgi:uncharacterized membrane protein (UPF0127 family)